MFFLYRRCFMLHVSFLGPHVFVVPYLFCSMCPCWHDMLYLCSPSFLFHMSFLINLPFVFYMFCYRSSYKKNQFDVFLRDGSSFCYGVDTFFCNDWLTKSFFRSCPKVCQPKEIHTTYKLNSKIQYKPILNQTILNTDRKIITIN